MNITVQDRLDDQFSILVQRVEELVESFTYALEDRSSVGGEPDVKLLFTRKGAAAYESDQFVETIAKFRAASHLAISWAREVQKPQSHRKSAEIDEDELQPERLRGVAIDAAKERATLMMLWGFHKDLLMTADQVVSLIYSSVKANAQTALHGENGRILAGCYYDGPEPREIKQMASALSHDLKSALSAVQQPG